MRIVIVGQQAFGKAVLEAFIARGDTVAGVKAEPPAQRRGEPRRAAGDLAVAFEDARTETERRPIAMA